MLEGLVYGLPRAQSRLQEEPFHFWTMPENDERWLEFYRTENGFLLRFPDIADFLVAADGLITVCHPVSGVREETTEHLFLNQIFPLTLNVRGQLAFHASSVTINGSAVAFVGASGRGKSTLAASFATNGCDFLTDDGLIVERLNGAFNILPSHPSIRLWGDSRAELLEPDAETMLAVGYTSKSRFSAGKDLSYCNQAMPFRAAYILGTGDSDSIAIRSLKQADYLIEMVKHSYQLDIEDRSKLAQHFDSVADLCRVVPGFHLDYPRHYAQLGQVRQAIEIHIEGLEATL